MYLEDGKPDAPRPHLHTLHGTRPCIRFLTKDHIPDDLEQRAVIGSVLEAEVQSQGDISVILHLTSIGENHSLPLIASGRISKSWYSSVCTCILLILQLLSLSCLVAACLSPPLIRTPLTLDRWPIQLQDNLIFTNYICNDLISKKGCIPKYCRLGLISF